MSDTNKATLQQANACIVKGDNEGFLSFCAEDIIWTTVGGETLTGKDAVRQWMKVNYTEPPTFTVRQLIADSDFVVALGEIEGRSEDGRPTHNLYSDVWRVRDGQMAELQAFVIEVGGE